MARGSVRKKGSKWYYRFYVKDEYGNTVQKEFAGTENRAETERLMRKAMTEYEEQRLYFTPNSISLGRLLDVWLEEECKRSALSNGTVSAYIGVVRKIQGHPISRHPVQQITPEQLQSFVDTVCFEKLSTGKKRRMPLSRGYMLQFLAVLRGAFRFAVFPKQLIRVNPMQYVRLRGFVSREDVLFQEDSSTDTDAPVITHEQFLVLTGYMGRHASSSVLPVQIAYYTGLRVGEVCGLTWADINLESQFLTVRRSMRYNPMRHKVELDTTKRGRVRTVDFGDTLRSILEKAKASAERTPHELKNIVEAVQEDGRVYYEVRSVAQGTRLSRTLREMQFVCLQSTGAAVSPNCVNQACNRVKKNVKELSAFHFHMLRHTYASNLILGGASPAEVQELLGHKDVATTLSIYPHANREAKRASAKILDRITAASAPDFLPLNDKGKSKGKTSENKRKKVQKKA